MTDKIPMVSASVEIQKNKEMKKAINKSLNLVVAQNTPIEQIVKKSFDLFVIGLSASNGAIYCNYLGMEKGAVVRASNMLNDVLKGFYPMVKSQASHLVYLTSSTGQVKMSSLDFFYRQATIEEIKALELSDMPKIEGIKAEMPKIEGIKDIQANKTDGIKTAVLNK